ncbi:ycf3-interacting protein 1, chloroplastic-like [Hibiscus syriacus]|nr:ycf3-interacting protein 1, chloroplastic-like [Hibiscus syriacus]
MGTLQAFQMPLASSSSSISSPPAPKALSTCKSLSVNLRLNKICSLTSLRRRRIGCGVLLVVGVGKGEEATRQVLIDEDEDGDGQPEDDEDFQSVRQVQRVLELLKKNRDMLFNEVKLTVMIEDPREVERRRLLGIEDPDAPTRDDLVEALEQVNEGKIPTNRVALRMLAEEMINWPNVEVEAPKQKRSKSLYARATDTGIDPREAAMRLNIDWDSAAEIEDVETSNETEVPPCSGLWGTVLGHCFSSYHWYICSVNIIL